MHCHSNSNLVNIISILHPHFPLEIAQRSVDFSICDDLLQTDQISSFARFAVDEMKILLGRKNT